MTMLVQQAIRQAKPSERDGVIDTITHAFESDPAARWMYPASSQYHRHFPTLIGALGGRALDHDSAFRTDDFAGAALWLPPDVGPDEEALMALVEMSVDDD